MNLTTTPASYPVTPGQLSAQLGELAVDLTRLDVKLEENQRNDRYPTNGYPEWFRGLADRIDMGRTGVAQLLPQREDLVHRMGQEAIDLGEYAGQTRVMQRHQLSFANGWDTLLDSTIRTVQEAAAAVAYAQPTPGGTPTAPTVPPTGSNASADAGRAAELVRRSMDVIRTVPSDDRGSEATKDARIEAYRLNMQAQDVLGAYFGDEQAPGHDAGSAEVLSQLRRADAHLEDANWQLAKQPSPDGRFNGVDIPGALRDSQVAVELLEQLAAAA